MADILFVCVSKDLARADALAGIFQAAGFSIGDLRRSDAELDLAGAGLLIWSQAASESAPFCEAASHVVRAGKAVVASFDEAATASYDGSPVVNLSHWSGDPDDTLLDPLFSAIDRMTTERRALAENWVGSAPTAERGPASEDTAEHASVRVQRAPGRIPKTSVRAAAKRRPKRRSGGRSSAAGAVFIPLLASAAIAAAVYLGAVADSRNISSAMRVAIPQAEVIQLVSLRAPPPRVAFQTASREAAAETINSPDAPLLPPPRARLKPPSIARFDIAALSAPSRPQLLALANRAIELDIEPAAFRRRAFNGRGEARRESLSAASSSHSPVLQTLQTSGSALSFGPPPP